MSQTRCWCFTIWDKDWSIERIDTTTLSNKITYLIYQYEQAGEETGACDSCGTENNGAEPESQSNVHVQGYIECVRSCRLGTVRRYLNCPHAHLEPKRGTRGEARDYCRKDRTRLPGTQPTEYGIWREHAQGERREIGELKEVIDSGGNLLACYEANFQAMCRLHNGISRYAFLRHQQTSLTYRHLETSWIWGETRTGKTRSVYERFTAAEIYPLTQTEGTLWFDGYWNQPILLLDDFNDHRLHLQALLRLLDGYPMTIQVKGGTLWAAWTHVVITTNRPPAEFYPIQGPERDALNARLTRIGHKSSLNASIQWTTGTSWDLPEQSSTPSLSAEHAHAHGSSSTDVGSSAPAENGNDDSTSDTLTRTSQRSYWL